MTLHDRYISWTIYARQGSNKYPDGSVGLSFKPAPSATRTEIYELIDVLQHIARQLRADANPELDDEYPR